MKIQVLEWDIYWYFTILSEVDRIITTTWTRKRVYRVFKCKCKCWNIKEMKLCNLKDNRSISCWCIHKAIVGANFTTHWMTNTRIYNIWNTMKARCDNINQSKYYNYWAKWIAYTPKWNKFEWFYEDMKEWYSKYLTLDRIDNNWNYSKKNCRWATMKEQSRNKRNNRLYKWKCIAEWCEDLWLNYKRVMSKINKYWVSEKKALGF